MGKAAVLGLLGLALVAFSLSPAFADHPKGQVEISSGSSLPGCEEEENGCYSPATTTVDKGSEVTWINMDTEKHTVTSEEWVFDSKFIEAGDEFTRIFTEEGEFPYVCSIHPWMTGVVLVEEGSGDQMDSHGEMKMGEGGMMDGDGHMDGHGDGEMKMGEGGMMDGDGHMDGGHGEMDEDHGGHGSDAMMDQDLGKLLSSAYSNDGQYMVNIYSDYEPAPRQQFLFTVQLTDAGGSQVMHVNYDVMAMQDGTEVLNDQGAHQHMGSGDHRTRPLDSDAPVDITVTLNGLGIPGRDVLTGPIGDTLEFKVVPEFGAIAVLVLAAAIVTIIAATSRSGLIARV